MKNNIKVQAAIRSKIKGYNAFIKDNETYLGKRSSYDNEGNYNNTNNDFIKISDNKSIFHLISSDYSTEAMTILLIEGAFTTEDLKKYYDLIKKYNIPLYEK